MVRDFQPAHRDRPRTVGSVRVRKMKKRRQNAVNYKNVKRNRVTYKLRNYLHKRRRQHDPLLALNMSIFNFEGGWSHILNPIKIRENN